MSTVEGLVLFHGAGGDRNHHLFRALERSLDMPVARVDFPYRRQGPGRRFPDRMPKLIDAVVEAVDEASTDWGLAAERLVIGGRSMGGRAASMAAAEGQVAPAGLVLLSYPLHPPGKPDKLRIDHLGAVTCPTLLVQGRSDPFGTPAEFARHLAALAGSLTEHWLDATHDPPERLDAEIVEVVDGWLSAL